MSEQQVFDQWREIRRRLAMEQKALAEASAAYERGEHRDATGLAIKHSEVRALRALSKSFMKKSLAALPAPDDRPR